MSRYIVTELVGYLEASKAGGKAPPGLSCHVIDTAANYRLMATYRTETYGTAPINMERKRTEIRAMAREHAERLNAR